MARILNLPMSAEIEDNLRKIWGQHPSNLIKTSWPGTDVDKFYMQWEDLDVAEPWSVFPGTEEALKKLSERFYLSILTSRNMRTTLTQLKHNGILSLFTQIIASDSSPYNKPDPRSIECVFHRAELKGGDPKKTVFVGDTIEGDWKLAQAAGIEFFAVLSGGMDTREKFLAAGVHENHVIDSVADLPGILLAN